MITHICTRTGSQITGKAYVLKSTEGEELIAPEALFSSALEDELPSLLERLRALEEAVTEIQTRPENEDAPATQTASTVTPKPRKPKD